MESSGTSPLQRIAQRGTEIAGRSLVELHAIRAVARSRMIGIEPPHKVGRALLSLHRYGPMGGAVAVAAGRDGERIGLVDELGPLSFADLDRRSNALANAWRAAGARAGTGVGILCRNHRGFLDATFACGKLGGRAVYLNTDFAGPQVTDVSAREGVELLVHDEEFAEIVAGVEAPRGRFLAWSRERAALQGEGGTWPGPPAPDAKRRSRRIDSGPRANLGDSGPAEGARTLEEAIAQGDPSPPPAPAEGSKVVMLTSGTTGTPKGAPRQAGGSLAPLGALLSKVPFRAREGTFVAAPLFHALGFSHAMLAVGLGSTIVASRRFDPEHTLAALAEHRCTGLIVVPVMLQRMLALGEEAIGRHDLSCLRIIFCAGAQLEADLATRAQDTFGDVVYNLYGSTEVAYATIATPEDLRAAPGCAGRPPFGTRVRLYDSEGRPVTEPGATGRIFVGNPAQFEGYTGGGTKEVIDGLMSTGDVGHFDQGGRLFIDGRDDEMIVSGGENVFPREVEELLATHEAIHEAAAIGVPDDTFGKRLRAFVVLNPDQELSEDDVKEFVRSNLARYKVPRDVAFLDSLPRNPSGKVLKRELSEYETAASPGPAAESEADAA